MKLTISYLPTNRPNCCWKEDGRRTLHGDGRQSLAIGHLSISGDLKKICTVHTFSESIFPQITVALRRKLNHPHNLISHFWMPLETLAYCSSSIVNLQAKKIFRNSSLACICGKLSTFFQNVEHKSIPSMYNGSSFRGVFCFFVFEWSFLFFFLGKNKENFIVLSVLQIHACLWS